MDMCNDILGLEQASSRGILYTYYLWLEGGYDPSDVRPVTIVKGERRWYAPWLRYPDQRFEGMSEAMAYRAQKAMDQYNSRAIAQEAGDE